MEDETMLESEQELTDVSADTENVTDEELLDGDEAFEYDEDGNIVIPDATEEDAEEDLEEIEEDVEDSTPGTAEDETPSKTDDAQDAENARVRELEARLERLQAQAKDTLKKLGVETDDALAGLTRLAAEADGVTPAEYAKRQAQEKTLAQARQLLQQTEFEKKASADLAALHAAYPDTRQYSNIRDIPNLKRFGDLRDLGLSPKEAYAAANPDGVRTNVADAVKKQSLADTKGHLRSAVPRGSHDTAPKMSRSELAQWRDIFPDLSDKEILKLYRQTEDKE